MKSLLAIKKDDAHGYDSNITSKTLAGINKTQKDSLQRQTAIIGGKRNGCGLRKIQYIQFGESLEDIYINESVYNLNNQLIGYVAFEAGICWAFLNDYFI